MVNKAYNLLIVFVLCFVVHSTPSTVIFPLVSIWHAFLLIVNSQFSTLESKLMELDQKSSHLHSTHQTHQDLTTDEILEKCMEELKELQQKCDSLESQCDNTLDSIQASHMHFLESYFAKRSIILNGENEKARRFPKFWVSVLKQASKELSVEISDLDGVALEYLRDIKYTALDEPKSWKLDFIFASNPYFKNTILTKQARYSKFRGQRIYTVLEGTVIEWFHGKCLTQKIVKRMGKRYMIEANSFFNLFVGNEYYAHNEGKRGLHTQICEDIINGVIPHPLFFFLEHEFRHNRGVAWNWQDPTDDDDLDCTTNSLVSVKEENLGFDDFLFEMGLVELYTMEVEIEDLEKDMLERIRAVEKAYQVRVEPLYNRRGKIVAEFLVAGAEPTAEEMLPAFWLNAMQCEKSLGRMISDHDASVLLYLKDIKFSIVEPMGWKLEFFFDLNPYFENSVLTKEMHFLSIGGLDELSYSIGTEIKWYPDGFWAADDEKPIGSFFNLFNGLEDDGYSEEDLQRDGYICGTIMRRIIPHAGSFYFDSSPIKARGNKPFCLD